MVMARDPKRMCENERVVKMSLELELRRKRAREREK